MKRIGMFWVVLVLVIGQAYDVCWADTISVDFVVVDKNGEALAEVELATRWIFDSSAKEKPKTVLQAEAVTDVDGKATIEFDTKYSDQFVVLGYTKDRQLGGLIVVESQNDETEVGLELKPTTTVTASYTCSETDSIPSWTNTIISIKKVPGYFFELRTTDGHVEFQLPPGKWEMHAYGSDIVDRKSQFETSLEQPKLEMGEIDFKATPMAILKGKPAPKLELVGARGLPDDFQLADLKGKWVLIEFWGYW